MNYKLILPILSACTFLLFATGCATNPFVDSAISLGITETLRFGVSNSARRTVIADYANVAANALYAIVVLPTPEQLIDILNSYVPAKIRADYPEIVTLVYPIIISGYKTLLDKYGSKSQKVLDGLRQLALDIQVGVSPFITR